MRDQTYTDVFGDRQYVNPNYRNKDNPWEHWQGMPHYDPADSSANYMTLDVEFEDDSAVNRFAQLTNLNITPQTKSIWYPEFPDRDYNLRWHSEYTETGEYKPENFPKYPIYIISKGRWEKRPTSDSLIALGLHHYMVVEASQYAEYAAVVDPKYVTLLILPQKYLDEYDTFDNLGFTKGKGPGAARNFAWDHSFYELRAERHWVMDDNQQHFYRHDADKRIITNSGSIFRAMEDHTDRYENVLISGPTYRFLAVPKQTLPPFVQNTRIYSTLLIKNDIAFRWRGRYNEDTDLSLRVLKAGYCTIQYYAFTTGKLVTQAMKGGNTDEFYAKEGTKPKSQMLVDMHPDVARLSWMNNRWHHYVNYAPFESNRLVLKKDYYTNPDPEYGMRLVRSKRS